jgi:peptide deformylase
MIFRGKQLIFRQMTQVLTITQLGNPILQQKAPRSIIFSILTVKIHRFPDYHRASATGGNRRRQVAQSLGLFIVFSPQSSLSRRSDDASHCADTFVII